MNKQQAFDLFNQMIEIAEQELFAFTSSCDSNLNIDNKADKSVVTACDKLIDEKLSQIAREHNLQIVSEEGLHVLEVVKSGNYITIDPIDGTLGYIEYVNEALLNNDLVSFGKRDLGAKSDFCLLLGIVENNIPKFGAVYNYITKEKIFVSSDPVELIRNIVPREYSATNCFYLDQRMGGELEEQIKSMPEVTSVIQAALGLKSIYTIINPHENAVTIHRVQSAGLWDIMPAAVAARAFNAQILDDLGDDLEFNEYIMIPGKGATIIKGEKFKFVKDMLKEIKNITS